MKRDLVLNASHELRTPLTAIKGFVEALEDRVEGEDKGYLEIIGRNTDRMIGIVQDLMTLAEMEDRGGRLEASDVDMKALAASVLALFAARAKPKASDSRSRPIPPCPRSGGTPSSSSRCSSTSSTTPSRLRKRAR